MLLQRMNHGKAGNWKWKNVHYHAGMKAGENTLNAMTARVVTQTLITNGGETCCFHPPCGVKLRGH